jgi:FKBP-type peptidyl-prolyl cis-trans isomerase
MKFSQLFTFLLAFSLLILSGCNNDDDEFDVVAQYQAEVRAIDQFLDANFPDHIKDPSGVRMVIKKLGTGLPAQLLSNINADYTGSLFSDNTVFETGNVNGQLQGFIEGWWYAFTTLPVGSEATLYIPSVFAYGRNSSSKIPANSTLIFDVNFKSMTQSSIYNNQFRNDTTAIKQYLETKGINATKDPLGIWYTIETEGTGPTPSWYNPVKLTYSFRLLNNDTATPATYDREPTDNFSSRVVDYVQGVSLMMTRMKEGTKARVYIPSGLGFGINSFSDSGVVVVPANSNLIVDIELKEVLD